METKQLTCEENEKQIEELKNVSDSNLNKEIIRRLRLRKDGKKSKQDAFFYLKNALKEFYTNI